MSPSEQDVNDMLAIFQKLGLTIWQLQELEWSLANFIVIKVHATGDIGQKAGQKLLTDFGKRTFGSLLKELRTLELIDSNLAENLNTVLMERNWIVHQSRRDSRGILNSPGRRAALIERLEKAGNEALLLLKCIARLIEEHVVQSGVSQQFIDRESLRLIRQWNLY